MNTNKLYSMNETSLIVSIDKTRELFIMFRSATKNSGTIWVVSKDRSGDRQVAWKGQKTRVRALVEAIELERDNQVLRIAKSIADYQLKSVSVHIFSHLAQTRLVKYVATKKIWRREGFLKSTDVLGYILKDGEGVADAIKSIDNLEDLKVDDRASMEITEHGVTVSIVLEACNMIRKITGKQDLQFWGGNPDSSMFLMSTEVPPHGDGNSQKAAKIKLSGGIIADASEILFMLKEFPKSADGLVAILSKGVVESFNALNCLRGVAFQVRMFKAGHYALKGMMALDISKTMTWLLEGYDAVLDYNEFQKIYKNPKYKLGDVVKLSEILIMASDADLGVQDIHVGYQVLSRIPENYSKGAWDILWNQISEIKDQAEDAPASLLPDFGLYRDMKYLSRPIEITTLNPKTGVEEPLDYQAKAQETLDQIINRLKTKGAIVEGARAMNLPDSELLFDEVIIGRNILRDLNLKVGDRMTFIVTPALRPGNKEESAFIFSKEIVGACEGNTVFCSPESNLYALRDYDGDVIMMTPYTTLKAGRQERRYYSAKAPVPSGGATPMPYSERAAVLAFCRLSTNIGMIDTMVETCKKINPDLDDVFLNHCMQAEIERKKWQILPQFSKEALIAYLKKNTPASIWKGDTCVAHPDIAWRKGNDKVVAGLSKDFKKLYKRIGALELSKIQTQKQFELNEVAMSYPVNEYMEKLSLRLKTLVSEIWGTVITSYSDDKRTEIAQARISILGKQVRKTLDESTYFHLAVAVLGNQQLWSSKMTPFWLFGGKLISKIEKSYSPALPINEEKAHCIQLNGYKDVTLASTKTIRVYTSKANPLVVDDEPILKAGDMIESVFGDSFMSKIGQLNVNRDKSMFKVPEAGVFEIETVALVTAKDGKSIVITGLDITLK